MVKACPQIGPPSSSGHASTKAERSVVDVPVQVPADPNAVPGQVDVWAPNTPEEIRRTRESGDRRNEQPTCDCLYDADGWRRPGKQSDTKGQQHGHPHHIMADAPTEMPGAASVAKSVLAGEPIPDPCHDGACRQQISSEEARRTWELNRLRKENAALREALLDLRAECGASKETSLPTTHQEIETEEMRRQYEHDRKGGEYCATKTAAPVEPVQVVSFRLLPTDVLRDTAPKEK
jgi:hypothetical protein